MVNVQSKSTQLNQLLREHEYLVYDVAANFNISPDYKDEILQTGRLALIKAYEHFNANRGVSFRGFARRCVSNAMTSCVRDLQRFYRKSHPSDGLEQISENHDESDQFEYNVIEAVECLPNLEQDVIVRRYGLYATKKSTLKTLGQELGISYESVRRIEVRALAMLKKFLLAA